MTALPSAVVAAAFLLAVSTDPNEPWIRANYVKDDGPRYETGYPRVAVNRFRQSWVTRQSQLSPFQPWNYRSIGGRRVHLTEDGRQEAFDPPSGFRDALDQVLSCVPQLSKYRDEIFVPEHVRLEAGQELVTFYLFPWRDAFDMHPLWLSSVVLIDTDGQCSSPSEAPRALDDKERVTLEPWDLFAFRGSRFLLTLAHGYEVKGFRLFRIENQRLVQVLEFWFACVGCE